MLAVLSPASATGTMGVSAPATRLNPMVSSTTSAGNARHNSRGNVDHRRQPQVVPAEHAYGGGPLLHEYGRGLERPQRPRAQHGADGRKHRRPAQRIAEYDQVPQ